MTAAVERAGHLAQGHTIPQGPQGRDIGLLPNSYSISPISNALTLRTRTEARQAPRGDWQRIKLDGFASHWLLAGDQISRARAVASGAGLSGCKRFHSAPHL